MAAGEVTDIGSVKAAENPARASDYVGKTIPANIANYIPDVPNTRIPHKKPIIGTQNSRCGHHIKCAMRWRLRVSNSTSLSQTLRMLDGAWDQCMIEL